MTSPIMERLLAKRAVIKAAADAKRTADEVLEAERVALFEKVEASLEELNEVRVYTKPGVVESFDYAWHTDPERAGGLCFDLFKGTLRVGVQGRAEEGWWFNAPRHQNGRGSTEDITEMILELVAERMAQ